LKSLVNTLEEPDHSREREWIERIEKFIHGLSKIPTKKEIGNDSTYKKIDGGESIKDDDQVISFKQQLRNIVEESTRSCIGCCAAIFESRLQNYS